MNEMQRLIELYQTVFYLEDPSVIPLVVAVTVAAKMAGDPIWVMLVGPSSAGKTEILNVVTGVDYVRGVDLLTSNTLLSGMKGKVGKETSLLLKMKRQSVMVMRDFTTILSMNKDEQQEIMGQFRQIFDGVINKDTGTGEQLEWKGKMCLLAGVTEKIHVVDEKFSSMGTRFIHYTMPEQDRIKTTKRASELVGVLAEKREMLKNEFTKYINDVVVQCKDKFTKVEGEVSENLINLADMASLSRSPIERDYKGDIVLALSKEMPMRLSNQLHTLGGIFMTMFNGKMPVICEKALYKIAIDSIPKGRRMVMQSLAKFEESTTKRIAVDINYSNELTKKWLQELNIIGVVERIDRAGDSDMWLLKQPYVGLMHQFGKIQKSVEKDPYADERAEYEESIGTKERNQDAWDSL